MFNGAIKEKAITALKAAQAKHEYDVNLVGEASARLFELRRSSSEQIITTVENYIRALLEIRYDRFSRGFERDSKAGCGRQHNEAAWPELHARRNAIRLI